MALRNIVKEGDEILTKRAKEVTGVNDRIRQLLDDMIETMRENDGIGLAAPQVGVLRRVFVVELEDKIYELINPEIVKTEGTQTVEEGCLSVPGCVGTVERPAYIKMKGLDRNGNEIEVEGTELLAVALSHEYDHLEGILFVDKALEIKDIDELENDGETDEQ
jgi:peptide deformylase